MNRLLHVICACFLMIGTGFAQSLDSSMNVFNNKFPQEKLHIHFDKDSYLPGETIWMKAYLISGAEPSEVSKNIYFDWTDADGKLLLHSISPISEGGASSFFKIPSWVKNGVIHVKSYTQWMLNFDNDFLFNKDIPVLMPTDDGMEAPEKLLVTINFFPEGGDLINGVSSLLAFEALSQYNKPVFINGAIKNSKNAIIDSFSTSYKGMGYLKFKPLYGEKYTAYWTDQAGFTHITPLPTAKSNGIVLHVDPYDRETFHFKLEKSADAASLTQAIVVGTINQQVVYRNSLKLENNKAEGLIRASAFPGGILQLTVFASDMSPLAERVVFVNNQKPYARLQMKHENINLNRRAKNEISIEIPDSLVTNLSVSITDAGLGTDSSQNIYSDFLIAGDLKGNIPDAASYLSERAHADEHLNLLLMTHGWRKFNWEAVVSGKYPDLKYSRDNKFLSIKGEVKFSTGLDAHDSIAMLLISRDRKKHILKLPVDSRGRFEQNGLFFYDSVQVVYKFNNVPKLNSNGQIFLNADLLPALTPAKADDPAFAWTRVPEVILDKELNGNIIEVRDNSVQSNAMSYIVSPKSDVLGKNSESAAHYLTDNFVDLKFASVARNNGSTGDASLTSYNSSASREERNNVNITLDGSNVGLDDLKTFNMKEVLYIKFVSRTGQRGLPTLAITSRLALDQANILDNKTGFAVISGYTPVREFYQPKYNRIVDYKTEDFRSTLYWNPLVRLDKSRRKMKFSFYNNDVTNKMRIVVEGMTEEGKLCRIEEIIK